MSSSIASSLSTGSMSNDIEGTKIEVTVQSLEGVMIEDNMLALGNEGLPAEVIATVTFSGSAQDMEVCSSTLCVDSGALMIESEPLDILDDSPLVAGWKEKKVEGKKGVLPHMTMRLPCRDPSLPRESLSKANRGSRIVKELPSLDEIDTQSTVTAETMSTYGSNRRHSFQNTSQSVTARSASALWSNSGAAMPEIIELTTRVKVQGSETTESQKGIAYLVLFGNDDRGTYWMDLPVRQLATPTRKSSVYLSENARLRVKVRVYPQERAPETGMVPSRVSSSRSEDVLLSQSVLEEQLAPLVERIRRNEETALEYCQRQKRAMDVRVPIHSGGGLVMEEENSLFCTGPWNWNTVLQTLASAVTAPCRGGSALGVYHSSGASVSSTIATRESMVDLWK